MAISRVQAVGATTSTVSITNTAGNLIVVVARLVNGIGTTISDSLGNTWNLVQQASGASAQYHCLWYAANCKGGSNTITLPLGYSFYQEVVAEYSGIKTVSPLDKNSVTTSSGVSSLQTGSIKIGRAHV